MTDNPPKPQQPQPEPHEGPEHVWSGGPMELVSTHLLPMTVNSHPCSWRWADGEPGTLEAIGSGGDLLPFHMVLLNDVEVIDRVGGQVFRRPDQCWPLSVEMAAVVGFAEADEPSEEDLDGMRAIQAMWDEFLGRTGDAAVGRPGSGVQAEFAGGVVPVAELRRRARESTLTDRSWSGRPRPVTVDPASFPVPGEKPAVKLGHNARLDRVTVPSYVVGTWIGETAPPPSTDSMAQHIVRMTCGPIELTEADAIEILKRSGLEHNEEMTAWWTPGAAPEETKPMETERPRHQAAREPVAGETWYPTRIHGGPGTPVTVKWADAESVAFQEESGLFEHYYLDAFLVHFAPPERLPAGMEVPPHAGRAELPATHPDDGQPHTWWPMLDLPNVQPEGIVVHPDGSIDGFVHVRPTIINGIHVRWDEDPERPGRWRAVDEATGEPPVVGLGGQHAVISTPDVDPALAERLVAAKAAAGLVDPIESAGDEADSAGRAWAEPEPRETAAADAPPEPGDPGTAVAAAEPPSPRELADQFITDANIDYTVLAAACADAGHRWGDPVIDKDKPEIADAGRMARGLHLQAKGIRTCARCGQRERVTLTPTVEDLIRCGYKIHQFYENGERGDDFLVAPGHRLLFEQDEAILSWAHEHGYGQPEARTLTVTWHPQAIDRAFDELQRFIAADRADTGFCPSTRSIEIAMDALRATRRTDG